METPTPTSTPTNTPTPTPDFSNEETDSEVQDILRNTKIASPKESAQTIERAEHLDMHPDSYNEMGDELNPEMEIQKRVPAQVGEPLKKIMRKSSESANLVSGEIGILDLATKQAKHIWYNLTEKHVLEGEIQELNRKDRTSELGLDDTEKDYLNGLYDMQQEEISEFGLEGYQEVPGQVVGVINDMFQAITKNTNLIAAGAVTGGSIGLFSPAAPITAAAGFVAGAGIGATSALALDAYYKVTDSTYGELSRMKNDDGTPLNLSRDMKDNISMSVGAISAVLEGVTGHVLTGGLAKLASPKTVAGYIVKSPAMKSAADILGHATKSAVTSGGEEVSAEIAALVGEEYAKGVQSEEGLMNAMLQTADDIMNNPETQKRLKMTAVVGAAAGGTIAGGTSAPTLLKGKKGYEASNRALTIERNIQTSVMLSNQSIEHQTGVLKFAALMEQTELKKLSPAMTSEFMQDSLVEAGYVDNVWFTDDDINAIGENNPEMVTKIRDMDATESSENGTGASVGVAPHEFMELVGEVPTVSEHARLNPEAPNPLESKNLLEERNNAEIKRQEFLNSLGADKQLTPEQIETLNGLDEAVDKRAREAGEQGYIDDLPSFSEVMKETISDKDLDQIIKAEVSAKEAVWLEVSEEFEGREQRIKNKVEKLNEAEIKKEEQIKFNNDIRVVNQFKYDKKVTTEAHKKKGYSPIAIDPASLPDNLREAYVTEPKLKKRKVFVEGGLTLDEAAAKTGVPTGEELLKILANTPTKKEMMAERRRKTAEVNKLIKESREVNVQERRDKAFDNYGKLQLKKLKVMKKNLWPAMKKGIKKIALPLPRIDELKNTARDIISRTKVGEVNARQFNAAEKSLQKKAVDHILKSEVEQAFVSTEKAMLNSELTRESLNAKEQIVKDKAFVKKITDKSSQKTLKKGGVLEEVNEILSLFDLTGSKPKGERQTSYFEYLGTLEERGETVIVPASLADIRQRGTDLTVEQHRQIVERLRTLNHQAKNKNKFLRKAEGRAKLDEIRTLESVVTNLTLGLQEHPKYSPERLKKVRNKNSKSDKQKRLEGFTLKKSWLTNMKNVAVELDGELLGGDNQNSVVQPLVSAETFERTRNHEVVNHIKKIATDYGKDEYTAAFNEVINIPEFENFLDLGDGKMVRSDLWRMLMHLGDPGTRDRMQNYKSEVDGSSMDTETVHRVLERVLTVKDVKLAQNFTNIFKTFEQEAMDLHERTTGVVPTMVKGVPIEIHGIVVEGGYTPADSVNISSTEKANRFLEVMGDKKLSQFGEKKDNNLYGKIRAAEMTDQGRLMDRTGSSQPLDTDFRGLLGAYEEHIHDIAYREPGTDVLKLLRNEVYSDAIIATVGIDKYNVMVSGVIETVGNINIDDTLSPFGKTAKDVAGVIQNFESKFAVGILGLKWKSVAMQALSLGSATLRMGPKGGQYLAKSLGETLSSMGTLSYSKRFDMAKELNPDLAVNMDAIDDSLITSSYGEIMPDRSSGNKTKAIMNKGLKHYIDFAMLGLKQLDIHIKAAVTMASYSQFMNGDVPNFPMAKLDKMTEVEKETKARNYIKQVADLALTTSAKIDKTAVEKIALTKLFTRFYTDTRAQLNTAASQIRKVDLSARRTITSVKKGDYASATASAERGARDAMSMFTVYALSNAYTSMLYEEDTPLDEIKDVNSMEDLKDLTGRALFAAASAPAKIIAGSIPVVRSIDYAAGSTRAKKQVSFPINRVFSDMSMTIAGLTDMYNGEGLTREQKVSMLYTASYFTKTGIPISGPEQILKGIQESELVGDSVGFLRGLSGELAQAISGYIDRNENKKGMEEAVQEAKNVQKELVPALQQDVKTVTPEDSMEVLKTNEWDDLDPETGAAGIYQFTETAWDNLTEKYPDLGLTENGRVSKDTREQESAMKKELDENTKGLTAYQVDVDNHNLYGAHRFGLEDYVMISFSKNHEKLEGIVENMDMFKGFKTVADVKKYIKKKLEQTESTR